MEEKKYYAKINITSGYLISPTEQQIMDYYGGNYDSIESVISDIGEEEMLREWGLNTIDENDNIFLMDINESSEIMDETAWNAEYKLYN